MYDLSRTIMDERLRQADRARQVQRIRAGSDGATPRRGTAARQLGALLAASAPLDVADERAWQPIRAEAGEVTSRLAGEGLLPAHLVADVEERPAVLVRLLLAAHRRLARAAR